MTTDQPDQYPVVITTTQRYLIWVDDWDREGVERLAKRMADAGDAYEHIPEGPGFDAWLDVEPASSHDVLSAGESECRYPSPQCAEPGCTNLMYYPIGISGNRCHKHKIAVQA